jgi:transcriptional regulator with XRE-family HTH domain
MIATDHQYRITSKRLSRFRSALRSVEKDESAPTPFRLVRARAIREQIAALEAELREYDELRSGRVDEIEVQGLADLPAALVKARIVRQLSQSALAELLGVKPQQVQRWEADGYSRVGFEHLKRIAGELRITIPRRLSLGGDPPVAPSEVRRAMAGAGLPQQVFDRAVLPRARTASGDLILADEIDARLHAIFGIGAAAMRTKNVFQQTSLRFKLPASASQHRTRAYAAYVEGVCKIVARCLEPTAPLPKLWGEMRLLLFPDGKLSLRSALSGCWAFGIGVIALDDPVAFHGACWRLGGRTVIVLKQPFRDEFKWLFDLIHELFHAVASPDGDFTILEADETSTERRQSREEMRANRFAAEVLTGGQLRHLTDAIVERAQGSVPRLKLATTKIAEEAGLPVGLLANLLAQRLAEEPSNVDWWATAASLQSKDDAPWKVVRDCFLENARVEALDRVERDILLQLMETPNG